MDQLHQVDSDKAIVIYHANCMDGFASAYAFRQLKARDYGAENVAYYSAEYGKVVPPDDCTGQDVYIVDFSYPRPILLDLASVANKVLVLDHHKTAKEALTNWPDKPSNLHIVFDMDRSGCGLTWDWFGYEKNNALLKIPRPALINYIEDRDLWRFALPWSKEINAVVANTEKDFVAYGALSNGLRDNLMPIATIGQHLVAQFDKLVKEIANDARECTISFTIGKDTFVESGLCSNCSPQFSSEVGNVLATKTGTFGATYHSNRNGEVKWSLRSNGEFDVSRIAKQFGGGGHRNAAGFVLKDLGESTTKDVRLWAPMTTN